jgi:N-acetylmuramoyl-L-alanine amidase
MKLLITTLTLLISFLFATPAFAYKVQEGDTLTQIASKNNLTLEELIAVNPQVQDHNLIFVGETINTELPKMVVSNSLELTLLPKLIRVEAPSDELEEINEQIQNLNVSQTVYIEEPIKTVSVVESLKKENYSFSDHELDLLARLVRAEAQTEPFDGKVAVACVVLNRLESKLFPDSIKEVIYERGQFQPVSNGEINKPADQESIDAVKAALTEQRQLAAESLFFYNPTIATSRWLDTRTTTVVIGQHVFKN